MSWLLPRLQLQMTHMLAKSIETDSFVTWIDQSMQIIIEQEQLSGLNNSTSNLNLETKFSF